MSGSAIERWSEPKPVAHGREDPSMPSAPLSLENCQLLADTIADLIIEQAARGVLQPGQRLKEYELAKQFNVSRLPVREALKELASQGVVYYAPRRGARLMRVDADKLRKVLDVRERLETLALKTALQMFRAEPEALRPLDVAIELMAEAMEANDAFGIAKSDVAFHRALCLASGNEVLVKAWSGISRQTLVLFALEHRERPLRFSHVELHRALRNTLAEADQDKAEQALSEHILQNYAIADRK